MFSMVNNVIFTLHLFSRYEYILQPRSLFLPIHLLPLNNALHIWSGKLKLYVFLWKKKNTRFGAILNVYYLKCKICDREKDHALNLLILYTVKQENLTHTYFSAKASTYTLVQINFCTHTFFKKKSFFFCLLNPATGFYFVFDQARKHIGFDFLSYIGKLSMEIINLLLYH